MSTTHLQRIALVTCDNVFEPGGVGNSLVRIARGLSTEFNIQVDILFLAPTERAEFNPRGKNGITQLENSFDAVTIFKLSSWTGGTSTAQHGVDIHYALLELSKERQYQLLHAFYASITGFPTVYAAHELNLPVVVSVRGNDINRDVFHTGRFHHLKWALENASQITAVSQEALQRALIIATSASQEHLSRARFIAASADLSAHTPHINEAIASQESLSRALSGACGARINSFAASADLSARNKGRVILNSIRPEDFAEGVIDLQSPRPVVGSLAVFKNKKGLEVLLCAFKMLLRHYPSAHLLLVGYVIPQEQSEFAELLAKYNLAGNMTLTGPIPRYDALRYLRAMDVFAFSSLHDGCPNAVLEAMLAGLPIVATRSGALPEMIEDGKQGLLVQPGSATQLYEALVKMLEADTAKQNYAQQARARVLTQFAPYQELKAYLEVYHQCLQSRRD